MVDIIKTIRIIRIRSGIKTKILATVVIREKNTRWNYLSRVACWAMYDAAVEGCAPIREIHVDAGKPHEEVEFAKFFGAKFNDESPDSGWTIFNLKSTENIALKI